MKFLALLFISIIFNSEASFPGDSSHLPPSAMNIHPYIQSPLQPGTPYGNVPGTYGSITGHQGSIRGLYGNMARPYRNVPGPYENLIRPYGLGLYGINGIQAFNNLEGAYSGLGATGHGYHDGSLYGKHGLAKGMGGVVYGGTNAFGGLYNTKGSYGDQFISGNSNTFAKEKVFSQNKNFGSGLKGGFGAGFGAHGGHHGQGGYGGYNGFGSIDQSGIGGQGLHAANGYGVVGNDHQSPDKLL